MKYVYLGIISLITSCHTSDQKEEKSNGPSKKIKEETYPKKVKDLKVESRYDKSKWALYCIYCDDTVKFEPDTKIKDFITFASLDLKLEDVKQFKDTTELLFYFYYKDTLKCDYKVFKNLLVATGTGFIKDSDSIRYYTAEGYGMTKFSQRGDRNPFANPLQPEVIKYINNNIEKLSPWFRDEAKRRGILQ